MAMAEYEYKRKGKKASYSSMIDLLTSLHRLPYHVLLILVVVFIFLGMSWGFSFNNVGVKKPLGIMGSRIMGWALLRAMPLLLMGIFHCLASPQVSKFKSEYFMAMDAHNNISRDDCCSSFSFKNSVSRSFTPWALAALIVLLLFMAKYQIKIWFF
ncbi:transmembrane protein, putative [Fagus crenata]